ncbi:MAG: SDR family oxidoreductase [Chlamydiae bacterium]|nr:SDR family oxidoreductase [Chlamydiota bacterium]
MPKKVLIIGANSFIGSNLARAFEKTGVPTVGTHYKAEPNLKVLDLLNPDIDKLDLPFNEFSHAIIAAGAVKIEFCEREKEISYRCNVDGPLKLAKQLIAKKITPIFFSSDYVFDGKAGNYTETSPLNPLNEYGRQKALLEQKIPEICNNNYIIFRLAKVFGSSRTNKGLIDEMIINLLNKKKIQAAYDQMFSPISIDDVVDAIIFFCQNPHFGLYNLCSQKHLSRLDLANLVAKHLNVDKNLIEAISLDSLKEPFSRPKNTSMVPNKIRSILNFKFSLLEEKIEQLIKVYK